MEHLKYVVYQEGKHYVSQCLNLDVSSFGDTIDDAVANLKEAVGLYLDDEQGKADFHDVGDTLIGEYAINA